MKGWPANALRVALMMLARRVDLRSATCAQGDGTKLNEMADGREKVQTSGAHCFAERQNGSSCGRMRPIDARRQSIRFGLKVTRN
jgi:hypothetical protein